MRALSLRNSFRHPIPAGRGSRASDRQKRTPGGWLHCCHPSRLPVTAPGSWRGAFILVYIPFVHGKLWRIRIRRRCGDVWFGRVGIIQGRVLRGIVRTGGSSGHTQTLRMKERAVSHGTELIPAALKMSGNAASLSLSSMCQNTVCNWQAACSSSPGLRQILSRVYEWVCVKQNSGTKQRRFKVWLVIRRPNPSLFIEQNRQN